jgi:hypothetical protein
MLILGHEKQEINDINFFINATNLVLLFSAPLFNIYCTFIQYSSNTEDSFVAYIDLFSANPSPHLFRIESVLVQASANLRTKTLRPFYLNRYFAAGILLGVGGT